MSRRKAQPRSSAEPVTNTPDVHPDATVGPDASMESTGLSWRERESTNAPIVGEEDASESYSQGYPELVEKLLKWRVPLSSRTVWLVILFSWFAFIAWIFLQDNESGALGTVSGLRWFAVKAGIFTGMVIVVSVLAAVILRVTRTTRSPV